jgi:GNAT superfamily N-acetyltransferase
VPRGGTDYGSRFAPVVTVSVRIGERTGERAAADRDFIRALGRRCAMSSVSPMRPAAEPMVRAAFDRLCEIVDSQSHETLIAQCDDRRVGFLLMLDDLPDEVTSLPQAFIAYMVVEPEWRRTGVGTALLAAAENEARRRGLPYMALMVTEENEAARRLYEGGGYRTERRLLCKPL